jgi:hypothetical protein
MTEARVLPPVVPVLLTEHHAMKAYWGSWGIAPRILDPGTTWKCRDQLHAPAALPPGKAPGPLDRSRSEHGGEEKNSHPVQYFILQKHYL